MCNFSRKNTILEDKCDGDVEKLCLVNYHQLNYHSKNIYLTKKRELEAHTIVWLLEVKWSMIQQDKCKDMFYAFQHNVSQITQLMFLSLFY